MTTKTAHVERCERIEAHGDGFERRPRLASLAKCSRKHRSAAENTAQAGARRGVASALYDHRPEYRQDPALDPSPLAHARRRPVAAYAPAPTGLLARTIATIPARRGSGSSDQAATTAANSASFCSNSAKLDAKRDASFS